MADIPVEGQFFLAFFWAMIGFGVMVGRLFVIERLRLLNGGEESTALRWGRRALDALIAALWLFAGFWLVFAVIRALIELG